MIDVRNNGAYGDGSHDDLTVIQNLINNNYEVFIGDGEFKIGGGLTIPDNRRVYLKNCETKQSSGVIAPIFTNANHAGNSNIKIIGLGNVSLNQNATENNDGPTRPTYGISQIDSWKYLGIFLCNVTNFELSGYTLNDQLAWGHLIQRCSYGKIKDLRSYVMTSIGNQDGLDIGHGSHDIEMDNCKFYAGDDAIAIVSWNGGSHVNRSYMGGETYNLTINNLGCNNAGSNYIRFLAGDRGIIRNVNITASRYAYGAYAAARFGGSGYPASPPTADELKDINIDGLTIDTITQNVAAIEVEGNCKNITFTNLVNNSGRTLYHKGSGTPENFSINGVQYT